MIDFSKLTAVNSANPQGQKYDLHWNTSKDMFRFSDVAYSRMQVELNSLTQFDDKDKVFLAVCPGDSGVFYKTRKGVKKGKTFKNSNLADALRKAGVTERNFLLVGEGEDANGKQYYRLEAYQEVNGQKSISDQLPTSEASEEKELSNQNDSF